MDGVIECMVSDTVLSETPRLLMPRYRDALSDGLPTSSWMMTSGMNVSSTLVV